jgi:flagellar protein FlhE
MMKRCLPALLLLMPLLAEAVSGSWVAEGAGVTLEQGGVRDTSDGLRPPNALPDANARITSVSWRYRLLSGEPAGLQVQLCTLNRCIPLGGGSGTSNGLQGEPANSELRFVYYVQSRGGLNPPLRVIGNQVIVNYQ